MHGARYALIRFLLLIIAVPAAITVLLPVVLARRYAVTFTWPSNLGEAITQGIGAVMLMLGTWLFMSSLYQIATRGEVSLAPWDPPRRLVIRGSYRRVRNPMISGVLFVLAGEALVLDSLPHALLALAFFLVSIPYIALLDEPQLEARFGDEYRLYRRHVARLLPRLRPWKPEV